MFKKNREKTAGLQHALAAALLSSVGGFASAGDFSLDAGSVTFNSTQTSTVAANGVATRVTEVSPEHHGIPTLDFDMTPAGIAGGIYTFRLGIVFDDDNSASRVEVYIPAFTYTTAGDGSDAYGVVDSAKPIRVIARDSSSTMIADASIDISSIASPVRAGNKHFSIDMSALLDAIATHYSLTLGAILGHTNAARNFSYTIAIQETNNAIRLGLNTGGFTAFPRIQSTCTNNTASQSTAVFQLKDSALATHFSSAYAIQGQFSVMGAPNTIAAAPTPFTEDCTVAVDDSPAPVDDDDDIARYSKNLDQLISDISGSSVIDSQTQTQIDQVFEAGLELAKRLKTDAATTSTADVLLSIETLNNLLAIGGATAASGGVIAEWALLDLLAGATDAFASLSQRSSLTQAETETAQRAMLFLFTNMIPETGFSELANPRHVQSVVQASSQLLDRTKVITQDLPPELHTQIANFSAATLQYMIRMSPDTPSTLDTEDPAQLAKYLAANPSLIGNALENFLPTLYDTQSDSDYLLALKKIQQEAKINAAQKKQDELENEIAKAKEAAKADQLAKLEKEKARQRALLQEAEKEAKRLAEAQLAKKLEEKAREKGEEARQARVQDLLNRQSTQNANQVIASPSIKGAGGTAYAATTAAEDFTVTIDPHTNVASIINANEHYAAYFTLKIAPASLPVGLRNLPDGRVLKVADGIAMTLSATAANIQAFSQAVADAGLQIRYEGSGAVTIDLGDDAIFSGTFAYDNLHGLQHCDTVTVAAPAGDVTSAEYAFTLICSDNTQQRITPFVHNSLFYRVVGDTGIKLMTDRNTGIVTIENVGRFKPSFFVTPLNEEDEAYFDATKNEDGIVFRSTDSNKDGAMDYEIIDESGVQILYSVPL